MGSELQKIGKRKTKVLAALLSLSILLSSFLIQRAYGTITTEYEKSVDSFGRVLFRFKLKVVIETEPDGTWIRNKLYRVDFIISLNFVNESRVKYGEVIFYDPGLINLKYPIGMRPNYISLRQDQEGAFIFKNSYEYATRLDTYLSIFFNFTEIRPKGEFLSWGEYFHSDSYCAHEPIYIDVKEPSSESLQPLSLIIGVVIGAVIGVGSTLLGIKIGEKRAEKKKANP